MPTITAWLRGGLERHLDKQNPVVVELPVGATLLQLQDQLGVPRGEVGLFLLDGELRDENHLLETDARVEIFPLFGGG